METNGKILISSPKEGLWSVATGWKNDWPADWHYVQVEKAEDVDDWKILSGSLLLKGGELFLQDSYKKQNGVIKGIRRFEWNGKEPLDNFILSVRWKIMRVGAQAFLPGILYYGNPSGEKNGDNKVPIFHGKFGELAIFEEHRYPMPFTSLEWQDQNSFFGAAMHTLPSPVSGGNHFDQ